MLSLARIAGLLSIVVVLSASMTGVRAQTQTSYPNDPLFPKQWYLHNTGQAGGTPGADMHVLEAWGITKCSPDEVIAMLDTGIDSSHPEFAGKLLPGGIYVPGVSSTEDVLNHGTGTAGVVAANTDNGQGIAGICPAGRILPVKAANDQGHTDDPEVGEAIQWAVEHGARVINLSLGTEDITPMRDAIAYAYAHNVAVVAAAGGPETYPADYPHVIAVGGSDKHDHADGTYPHQTHDLVVAPDSGIITTSNDGTYTIFCTCVSIAAPMVTGVVALLQSLRPDMTVDQIVSAIEKGADPIDAQSGFNSNDGWGRVNAYRSLQIAQSLPQFKLKATAGAKALPSGARQTLTVRSLSQTRISLRFLYPGGRTSVRTATIGSSGIYHYSWRLPHRAGKVSVSINATHGFVTKAVSVRFTIG